MDFSNGSEYFSGNSVALKSYVNPTESAYNTAGTMIRYLRFISLLSVVLFVPAMFLAGVSALRVSNNERSPLVEEEISASVCTTQRRVVSRLRACRLSSRDLSLAAVSQLRPKALVAPSAFGDRSENNLRSGLGTPILC
jgi:hypothetical protein